MSVTPHLFIPGPTNIPDAVRMAMNVPMIDMRSGEYPKLTLPIFEDLKKVFKMKDGRVFIFPSSGTGAWESAIQNTLKPGDKVLMSRFGQFSLLWVDMAERLGLKVELCDEEWGTGVPLEKYADILAKDKAHEIKAVFATHNETATGVTSDIAGVRKALDAAKHPALLMVDGVSSVGSLDMRMGEWGVDCCVSGSQKGFMLPTGLGILAVSQKALDANKANGGMPRCFLAWEDHIKTNDLGYFPYTPATQLLQGLRCSLDLIFAEGLENVFARHHRLANGVRAAVDAWGLKLCAKEAKWHSDTVRLPHWPSRLARRVHGRRRSLRGRDDHEGLRRAGEVRFGHRCRRRILQQDLDEGSRAAEGQGGLMNNGGASFRSTAGLFSRLPFRRPVSPCHGRVATGAIRNLRDQQGNFR